MPHHVNAAGRTHGLLIVAIALAVSFASAQEATVDGLKRRDPEVAALDRKLESVFRQASAKARDGMGRVLRTEQRGWKKGLGDCWKVRDSANAFYATEHWIATSFRECVVTQYRLRISELQSVWDLAPKSKPALFVETANPRSGLLVTFVNAEVPTARLERGDRTGLAWLVSSGADSLYEGQNISMHFSRGELTVKWLGDTLRMVRR
jgi:uncharacterized protein